MGVLICLIGCEASEVSSRSGTRGTNGFHEALVDLTPTRTAALMQLSPHLS